MSYWKTRLFEIKTFPPGAITRVVSDLFSRYGDPKRNFATIYEDLPDGTRSAHAITTSDLDTFCDLTRRRLDVDLCRHVDDRPEVMIVQFAIKRGAIELRLCGETLRDLDEIFSTLERELSLTPTADDEDPVDNLPSRVERLEAAVFGPSSRLKCFLSYRFASEAEAAAATILQFLSLLDVQVISGASYEPRRISDKVLSKLSGALDFILVLITQSGESMWTRDEIASAIGRGIAVIPVVEEGANFAPGLFGDLEYIPFGKGHVGDAFLKLLQALTFIRSERAGKLLHVETQA